jgi:L-ascorbate 6-phosphate lactonase
MQTITMRDLKGFPVPAGSLTLWWLGQAGFIVKSPGGTLVAVDPYLTNSCKAVGDAAGIDMDRLVPPPMAPADLVGIDLYALTHSHQDHLDPETIVPYRAAGGKAPFLAPAETIEKLISLGIPAAGTVLTWPNKIHVVGDVSVRATLAIPLGGDDLNHVGYVISVQGGPSVYFTGDTGYHEILTLSQADRRPDVFVAVINGAFRNLSPYEAALMAKQLDPGVVIPCHHDLFRDNSQSPRMLRTNLAMLGIADKYRVLEHGRPYTFPEPVPAKP